MTASASNEQAHQPLPDQEKQPTQGRFAAGELCPFCGQGLVDYDGTLSLVCPACGRSECGGVT